MAKHKSKDAVTLTYEANKRRIRTEVQVVVDAVLNEAFTEMTAQFNRALGNNTVEALTLSQDEVRKAVRKAAAKVTK